MLAFLDPNAAGFWELFVVFGSIGIALAFLTVRWAFRDGPKQGWHDGERDRENSV
jgi:hypothetical protein